MNTSSSFLEQIIRPLSESSDIDILNLKKHQPLSNSQIRKFQEVNNDAIPPLYVSLLQESNGIEIRWKFKIPLKNVQNNRPYFEHSELDGYINILPANPEKTISSSPIVFEYLDSSHQFYLSKHQNALELIGSDTGHSQQKIELEDYLKFLISSKGFLNWRYHWFFYPENNSTIQPSKEFWLNFELPLNLPNLINHFPLCQYPGSPPSGIQPSSIYLLTQNSNSITAKQAATIQEAHLDFLNRGGAGGKWQILQIKDITTAIYDKKELPTGKQASFEHTHISGKISFCHAILPFSNFCGVYAPKVDFSKAELSYSAFMDAILESANFEGALLQHTDFSRANLKNASFKKANLEHCDFEQCNLENADFTGAKLNNTRFPGAFMKNITY